jgi:IS605 OrfB family transposase
MYNITVTFVNYLIYDDKKVDIDLASGLCDFRFLRSILHDDKEKIINSMENKIRVHLLDEAIKHAVSNFKGCITKFQKGSIKKFRVREMSYNKPKKILIIESSFFGPSDSFHKDLGTMFASIFGKGTVETSYPLEDITKTATLQFNNRTKKYILFVPEILEQDLILKNEIDCGGDGGGRTFYTFYSKNGTYEFGPDMNRILKPLHIQIKTIESKINSKINPISKAKKRKMKKALAKRREYLKNKVKDMHYKVSHFLVNNFDNIYIGKLSTSQILRRSNNLPKNAKQVIKSLKHYQFRTILTHMGHRYGSKIYLVTEYLTTQTCSNCGALNDVGNNKIYHCKYCEMKTGRDENSAKNHLKIGYEDGTYIYKDKEYRKVELLTEIGDM